MAQLLLSAARGRTERPAGGKGLWSMRLPFAYEPLTLKQAILTLGFPIGWGEKSPYDETIVT